MGLTVLTCDRWTRCYVVRRHSVCTTHPAIANVVGDGPREQCRRLLYYCDLQNKTPKEHREENIRRVKPDPLLETNKACPNTYLLSQILNVIIRASGHDLPSNVQFPRNRFVESAHKGQHGALASSTGASDGRQTLVEDIDIQAPKTAVLRSTWIGKCDVPERDERW